jgi:hypothetical protein
METKNLSIIDKLFLRRARATEFDKVVTMPGWPGVFMRRHNKWFWVDPLGGTGWKPIKKVVRGFDLLENEGREH